MTSFTGSTGSGSFTDSIDNPYDYDVFTFELTGGIDYAATALGVSNGGGTLQDPAIFLLDSNFNLLNYSDDSSQLGLDPLLEFNVPSSGTYYMAVTDFYTGSTGSYTFVLNQTENSFSSSPETVFG